MDIITDGRRSYISGNTYPHRDALRAAGAHWDGARKMWWVASAEKAAEIIAQIGASGAPADAAPAQGEQRRGDAPGRDAVVAGRAIYRGRSYYIAGRVQRSGTRYGRDTVAMVQSRDGGKVLLYSRDGSMQFWARVHATPGYRADGSRLVRDDAPPADDVAHIERRYDRPQTIAGLASFAAEARAGFPGRATCRNCGSPSCEGARGGHCDED